MSNFCAKYVQGYDLVGGSGSAGLRQCHRLPICF